MFDVQTKEEPMETDGTPEAKKEQGEKEGEKKDEEKKEEAEKAKDEKESKPDEEKKVSLICRFLKFSHNLQDFFVEGGGLDVL